MEKEIKKDIANYYLSDSRQFLNRYELLRPIQTEIASRSKLLIDIVFSLECSLKALLFLESKLDEKATYKLIRKCGHDLRKLLEHVDSSSITSIVSVIDHNIEHFSISSRYTLDANIYFRNPVGNLSELYYSTIANHSWLELLFHEAQDLYAYVSIKIDNSIVSKTFNEIDIEKEVEKTRRIRGIDQK